MNFPYFQDSWVTIYHGDCREILPTLAKADLLFADPPYGVGFRYVNDADRRSDYVQKIPEWFAAFNADCIAVTPGIVNVCFWPQPRWILAWLKTNCMGASGLSGPQTVSRNQWEPILWYGQYPPNQTTDTLKSAVSLDSSIGDHPCPKPEELLRKIISFGSNERELVLDPFMGSGTTLRAAKDLGRKAIGVEIEERYCEIAARRMSQDVLNFAGAGLNPANK